MLAPLFAAHHLKDHKDVFLNYRRRIGVNPHITEVSGVECVDIDYPEDFEIANAVYMKMIVDQD